MFDRLWSEHWRRADVVLACALILVAVIVIGEANRLPPPFFDPLGSAAVPRFVSGILILLALAVLGRCCLTPVDRTASVKAASPQATPWVALGALVASVVYVGVMHAGCSASRRPPPCSCSLSAPSSRMASARSSSGWSRSASQLVSGLNYLLTEVFYIDLPQRSFFDGAD